MAAAAPIDAPVSVPTVYRGMCDASAAVALDGDRFAVANDEDNTLRIYPANQASAPVQSFDLTEFLGVDWKWPESDLEGAVWLGDRIFWITSHGRNREGKYRESRHRLFAITVQKTNGTVRLLPVGKPYTKLLDDLRAEPSLKPFKLSAASKRAPKHPGALNIEGLCSTPDQHLLIGFRNPIPAGRALLVPLLNPNEIISGQSARFGDPILLNLGGCGIRDMAHWHGKYLIVAGSSGTQGVSKVYLWKGGRAEAELMPGIDLHQFNPEAVIVYADNSRSFQLLSDDGTMEVGGVACKHLPDPMQRSFRSVWVTPARGDTP